MSPSERSNNRIPYRKLPGDFRGFFRRNTMWIGADHLLLVDSSRFSETYKRFYLRDIQSVIIRKTPRFVLPYYWVLLPATAAVTLFVALNAFREWLFWLSIVIFLGTAVYLYVASMFQSCVCHLVTRANNVQLPSLFRLRSARRFTDIMVPLITATQGELPANWVERSTTPQELSATADRKVETPMALASSNHFSWIAVAVFVLVLCDAAITWMQLRSNNSRTLSTPNMLNMVALAVCSMIAIVRLTRQKGSRALRLLVVGGLFVVAAVTYGSMLLQSFDQQLYHQNFENALQYMGMRSLSFGEIIADCAVALPGLIVAFRQKTARERGRASVFGPEESGA